VQRREDVDAQALGNSGSVHRRALRKRLQLLHLWRRCAQWLARKLSASGAHLLQCALDSIAKD